MKRTELVRKTALRFRSAKRARCVLCDADTERQTRKDNGQ